MKKIIISIAGIAGIAGIAAIAAIFIGQSNIKRPYEAIEEVVSPANKYSFFNESALGLNRWHQYKLDLTVTSAYAPEAFLFPAKKGSAGSQANWRERNIRSRLSGNLYFRLTEAGRVEANLDVLKIIFAENATSNTAQLQDELSQLVVISHSADGAIQGISFSNNISLVAKNIWAVILSQLQLKNSIGQKDKSWTTDESDYLAMYTAEYTLTGTTRDYVLAKKKSGPRNLAFKTRAVAAEASFDPASFWKASFVGGKLDKLTANETLAIREGGKNHYSNHVEMVLSTASYSGKNIAITIRSKDHTFVAWKPGFANEGSIKVAKRNAFKNALGKADIDSLIASLNRLSSPGEEVEVYKKIRAFIALHPNELSPFVDLMVNGDYNGPENRLIAVALGKVGHNQAQLALRDAAKGRAERGKSFLNYLQLLAQAERPSKETVHYLKHVTSHEDLDINSTAMLALGSALGGYAKVEPEETKSMILDFCAGLKTASAPDRYLILKLLGNSGSVFSVDSLEQIFRGNGTHQERAASLQGLRFVSSERARSILQEAAALRSQPPMQLAAINALQYRSLDVGFVEVLNKEIFNSKYSEIRVEALRLLWTHREALGPIGPLLDKIKSDNSDQKLRLVASQLKELS